MQRHACFQTDDTRRVRRFDAETWAVQRGLGIESIVNHAHDDLDVALRLHETANHAEWRVQRSVRLTRQHAGDDRVVRAFAWGECIWMRGIKRKIRTAILKRKTPALRHDAG